MKKRLRILFLFIVVIGISMTMLFCTRKGSVQISNQSSQEVLGGTLEVCRQKFAIEHLKPNEVQVINFKVKTDSCYDIVVHFKSGTIRGSLGYVTNGMDFNDVLVVSSNAISLEAKNSSKTEERQKGSGL